MTEQDKQVRKPDFQVPGVAIWVNQKKDSDEKYLTLKMVGHNTINVFKNNPRPKPEESSL